MLSKNIKFYLIKLLTFKDNQKLNIHPIVINYKHIQCTGKTIPLQVNTIPLQVNTIPLQVNIYIRKCFSLYDINN